MKYYSKEHNEAVLKKMAPPQSLTVAELAETATLLTDTALDVESEEEKE